MLFEKILFANLDSQDIDIINRQSMFAGSSIDIVNDVADALSQLADSIRENAPFDLFIIGIKKLDSEMLENLRNLRLIIKTYPEVFVLMISESAILEKIKCCLRPGRDAYCELPLNMGELNAQVAFIVRNKMLSPEERKSVLYTRGATFQGSRR